MTENAIRKLREERGWTLERLAENVGLSVSYVQRLEHGDRNLSVKHLDRFAQAFGVPREDILSSKARPEVPIVGLAGAGPDASVIYGEGQGTSDMAPAPPLWSPSTVALEVRGNSMRGIAYDGWFVYYDDVRGELTDDMIGQPCVLGLPDGRVVVKIPYFGRSPGTFDLESANQAVDTMRGERIDWACLVTAIVPRRAASRLLDRSSDVATV